MLKDRLYRIDSQELEEGKASFQLVLNAEDPVFQGHFPGQPVLPGACMMEMGRELLGELYGKPFDLQYAKNMKIPSFVDPREVSELSVDLTHKEADDGTVELKYSISGGGTVFFKFTGSFRG